MQEKPVNNGRIRNNGTFTESWHQTDAGGGWETEREKRLD